MANTVENLTPISVHLEEFKSSGEFDKFCVFKRSSLKKQWTDERMWQSIMWVMVKKGYISTHQILYTDVNKLIECGAYKSYDNNYRLMITQFAEAKKIDVGEKVKKKRNLFVFTKDYMLKNSGEPQTGVSLEDQLSTFDCDKFEQWIVANTRNQKKWNYDSCLNAILYALKKHNKTNIYDIRSTDFQTPENGNFFTCFGNKVYNNRYKDMVVDVLKHHGVDCDPSRFFQDNISLNKDRQAIMEMVPKLEITDEQQEMITNTLAIFDNIPSIFENMQPVTVNRNEKIGIVYVFVRLDTNTVFYVGSASEYYSRMRKHKHKFIESRHQERFYEYMVTNQLTFDDVITIPIIKCHLGFEVFVEQECYKFLKDNNYNLANRNKPTKHAIDDYATIYGLKDTNNNQILYVGSAYDHFNRFMIHRRTCYDSSELNKVYNSKIYKYIRSIGPENWPENIVSIPLERCPGFMRDERERHYIDLYNTKFEGLNTLNLICNTEQYQELIQKANIKNRENYQKYKKPADPKVKPVKIKIVFEDLTEKTYNSQSKAAKELNIPVGTISYFATTQKKTKYGFVVYRLND